MNNNHIVIVTKDSDTYSDISETIKESLNKVIKVKIFGDDCNKSFIRRVIRSERHIGKYLIFGTTELVREPYERLDDLNIIRI